MKNYLLYVVAIVCVCFVACSNDDDKTCTGKTDPISIQVEGISMTNIEGAASIYDDEISVSINGDSQNDARVFFSCPKELGTYDLNLDFSGNSESQTVTAFVPSETLNIILSTGCLEVVSVDSEEVIMRFNVNEDNTNINGEITLDVN